MQRLDRLASKLERRLDLIQDETQIFLSQTNVPRFTREDIWKLEGILSETWQVWCRFCRDVVIFSCTGSVAKSGFPVVPNHNNWETVSYIACVQKKGSPPSKVGTNTVLRKEPTWGHLDKLIDIINALSPSNSSSLLAAFGSVPKLDHIRLIRNSTAHRNSETHGDVLAFQAQYQAFAIRHPLQALFWIDPQNSQVLLFACMDEMRIAARNAVA